MQKIQLSVNKNEEVPGSASLRSNTSFRLAENLLEMDPSQQVNGNSFVNGQFKYQPKPGSPTKTDRFEPNGPMPQPKLEHMNSATMMS